MEAKIQIHGKIEVGPDCTQIPVFFLHQQRHLVFSGCITACELADHVNYA